MRSFVALELPPEVREEAARLMARLKRTGAEVKWMAPENLHVTLKFLGEVDPGRKDELIRALDGALAGAAALDLTVLGCGAFPRPRDPRVVWMGLTGQVEALAGLAARVEAALAALGFPPEERAFKPHITLGRTRRSGGGRGGKGGRGGGGGRSAGCGDPGPEPTALALARELAGLASHPGPRFRAGRVCLMESALTPQGAVYRPLKVFELGAGRVENPADV